MTMTRSEVAGLTGVGKETVRYYEQRGLLPKPFRNDKDYRTYTEEHVERIRFIKRAQELSFTLREIKELLSLRADPEGDCGDVRKRTAAKLRNVEQKIEDLGRIHTALSDLLRVCPGQGPLADCPILLAMKRENAS